MEVEVNRSGTHAPPRYSLDEGKDLVRRQNPDGVSCEAL